MNAIDLSLSRRALLQSAGALVVCAAAPAEALAQLAGSAVPTGKPPLHPTELDSWVAIDREGRVTAFFGKMDMGQGVDVAIGQIVADELDVPYSRVTVVMGDSGLTCNQGGASGSTGIQTGGHPLRNAAAEVRRLLVEQAAQRFGVAPEQCRVSDGVITAGERRVSYAELIGGHYFQHKLEWNNQWGNPLNVTGKAKPKSPDQYKIVGQSIPRNDVAGKVFGTDDFVTDITVPGMLHGRAIRPEIAGAVPVSVDEASIRDIRGARVVRKGDFIGVVAEKEWDAIRAAEQLKIAWSDAAPPFPSQAAIYDHIRNAPAARRTVEANTGDVDAAFAGAARVVEAEYQWPFQSHASMGPACAIVDARQGEATVWTGSQKPHFVGQGVARYLGLPPDKVRAIWIMGPGSYGRNDAGDAALDAAVMSQIVGKPVRVQGMRHEGHGWDPKGPASIHRCRAAIDARGNVIAYEFMSKGFSRIDMATNESNPSDTLAGMLVGFPNATQHGFGVPAESYAFASKRTGWETIAPLLTKASPLRTGHLRDPVGPQIHFASESFIDEVAAAIGADPVEFRLRHVRDPRDIEVIKATAEKAGWKSGPAGTRRTTSGDTLTGRGFAYSTRNGTVVAVVCDVEVNRRTGAVWARRFVVGHDCGIIVNPEGLRLCIEGNVVQAVSRALWEEIQFDNKGVTSTDWLSYPILDMTEAPESVECVLINRPAMNPRGAGEPSTRPMAGAVANAIYEATGVRIRRAPFTPDRVKAALA
jgi:CO/xanthine dehydrogenase Mo-binding subunit